MVSTMNLAINPDVFKTHKPYYLNMMQGGEWFTSAQLKKRTHRFSAVLNELRKDGWVIERERIGNSFRFRINGKKNHSTVVPALCPHCNMPISRQDD